MGIFAMFKELEKKGVIPTTMAAATAYGIPGPASAVASALQHTHQNDKKLCQYCTKEVDLEEKTCPHCGKDLGYISEHTVEGADKEK